MQKVRPRGYLKKVKGQSRLRQGFGGQALLIILLVMSVVLTVAISVVSRSITDIAVSQKEEEAARAFSAAEAGVERALLSGVTGVSAPGSVGGDNFTTSVSGLLGGASFVLPQKLASGETVPVWFIEHSGDLLVCDSSHSCFAGDSVTFHWGEDGTSAGSSTTPALEGIILYTTGSSGSSPDPATARIARVALDPHTGGRRGSNNFDTPSYTGCDLASAQFEFCHTISLSSLGVTDRTLTTDPKGAQTVRIRLLYNIDRTHPVAVSVSGGSLPSQGLKIDSSGTAGEATRRIEVYRLFADLPPVFDFAAFSGATGITK